MPLKMINAEEQVTEVITEVAEQIGFSDVKAKQREAILAFLSGKDTFCFYSHFCFCFYASDDESGSVVWLMLISSLRISSEFSERNFHNLLRETFYAFFSV